MIVEISQGRGCNLSLHPKGPKWTLQCGSCQVTFTHRLPRIDYPTVKCPNCDTLNRVPVVMA